MEYDRPPLSKAEREWVYKAHGIDNPENYEIHHIVPVAYAIALLGMAREEINAPENLIPLPEDEHREIHKPPHEIRGWLERREPYWNTDRDEELKQQATERTRAYEQQGNIFPGKRSV
jgi:hypothetical protein